MHILHFLDSGNVVELQGSVTIIGRDPGSDIVLEDPSVSGQHAALSFAQDSYTLQDLGSTNGTFVNDRPVSSGQLRSGDRVSFGSIEARYTHNSSPASNSATHTIPAGVPRFKNWLVGLSIAVVVILGALSLFSGKTLPPSTERLVEQSPHPQRETEAFRQEEPVSRDWVMVTVQTRVELLNQNRTGRAIFATVEPGDCFPILHNESAGYNEVVLGFGTAMFTMENSQLQWVRLSQLKEAQANYRGNILAFLDSRRLEREMSPFR